MGRERLMQKQRERMEARRKRLKEAAKKAAPKKQSAYDKYFADNKGKKGVTRKPGGASKTPLVLAPKSTTAPIKTKPTKQKPVNKIPSSAQANTGTGRDGKFGTGTYGKGRPSDSKTKTGTRGKPLPSNPKLKSQSRRNLTGKQKIALEVAAASGGRSSATRSASRKPSNPKKGQTYVTRTGMTLVWTGRNWKQKTK